MDGHHRDRERGQIKRRQRCQRTDFIKSQSRFRWQSELKKTFMLHKNALIPDHMDPVRWRFGGYIAKIQRYTPTFSFIEFFPNK